MNYKIAYSTINKEEVKAWECQIEKGRYYLPANATYLKPLENKDGFNIIFKNKKWVYEEIKIIEDRYIINKTTNEITKSNKELNDDEKVATQKEITKFKIKEKKQELLFSLEQYHYSDELRKITVNESIIINYHLEFRQLIDEQIINLQLKLDLKQITESDASFTYIDINNVDVTLTLEQLKKLSVKLKEIANSQWKIYIATKKEIEATETLKALESLDIERAYMKSINITI